MVVLAPTKRNQTGESPHIGAEFVLSAYTEDFQLAPGARMRAGLELWLGQRLGLELLGSLGFMRGRRFPEVQEGLAESGATWQLGMGTVVGL